MKKGFTLVELLMVMVIAGALVAVALPKYQRALERSRALEGLTNAKSAAEYANSYYLTHANEYPVTIPTDDLVKSRFFTINTSLSAVAGEETQKSIDVTRNATQGWKYKIQAVVDQGQTLKLQCVNTDTAEDCQELDLVGNLLK